MYKIVFDHDGTESEIHNRNVPRNYNYLESINTVRKVS